MALIETSVRYRWVALGIVCMAQLSNSLSSQGVAPLAPLFQPELGLTKAQVGFFSSAAYAGAWGVLLVAGSVTDRFGVRKMLAVGQSLIGLTLLCMAVVDSYWQALVVMFAVGLGRGGLSPGMAKGVLEWFPGSARGTAMGVKQAAQPAAGMMTASLLPLIALSLGWRGAIAVMGFLILGGGSAAAFLYRDSPPAEQPRGKRGSSIRAGLGEVLRTRKLWLVSGTAILFLAGQQALTAYLALYLHETVLVAQIPEREMRIVAAGGYLAVCQMGGVFGRIFWGVVSDRVFHGRRLVVLAMIGFLSALLALATARLTSDFPLWLLSGLVFSYGATAIGWNGLYQALITELVARKNAATGVGASMTVSQIGTMGGAPLFGVVVDLGGSYWTGWMLMAILSLVGSLMALGMSKGEKQGA